MSCGILKSAGRIPQALFEVPTFEEIDLHGNKFVGEQRRVLFPPVNRLSEKLRELPKLDFVVDEVLGWLNPFRDKKLSKITAGGRWGKIKQNK